MRDCCEITAGLTDRQCRVLRAVLWINLTMFVVEFEAGVVAQSTALLADSVDMLGDAVVYGVSLYVIGRGAVWQARGALLKGSSMADMANSAAIATPTTISGQAVAVIATPAAARMTPALAMTSLREQRRRPRT